MATKATVLLENASATGTGKLWQGGRGCLLIAGTLATTTKLQILGPDLTSWLDVATITLAYTALDLPAGSYRVSLSGGSPAALYAKLVSVPYL